MPKFTVTETLPYPAPKVWRVLTDFSAAPRWMNGIDCMELQGELAEGQELLFQARGRRHSSIVSKLVPGKYLELTSTQGKVTAVYGYALEEQDGTTRIRLQAVCRGSGLMAVVMPLLGWLIKKTDGRQMRDLKKYMDSRSSQQE